MKKLLLVFASLFIFDACERPKPSPPPARIMRVFVVDCPDKEIEEIRAHYYRTDSDLFRKSSIYSFHVNNEKDPWWVPGKRISSYPISCIIKEKQSEN